MSWTSQPPEKTSALQAARSEQPEMGGRLSPLPPRRVRAREDSGGTLGRTWGADKPTAAAGSWGRIAPQPREARRWHGRGAPSPSRPRAEAAPAPRGPGKRGTAGGRRLQVLAPGPGWGAGTECGSSEAAQGLRRSFVGAGGGPRCQTRPSPRPGRLVLPGNGASNAARRGPGPTGCAARTPPDPPPPRALVLGSEWPQAGLLGSDLAKRPE